ncbi:MAG: hypothetical protein WBX27_06465, partial [Specibacter sp.]
MTGTTDALGIAADVPAAGAGLRLGAGVARTVVAGDMDTGDVDAVVGGVGGAQAVAPSVRPTSTT